jgi:hypothetical protein
MDDQEAIDAFVESPWCQAVLARMEAPGRYEAFESQALHVGNCAHPVRLKGHVVATDVASGQRAVADPQPSVPSSSRPPLNRSAWAGHFVATRYSPLSCPSEIATVSVPIGTHSMKSIGARGWPEQRDSRPPSARRAIPSATLVSSGRDPGAYWDGTWPHWRRRTLR